MPTAATSYTDLPFDKAIAFFRGKVNIPTRRWNDLWRGMHARGFMIAGAMQDDLLADLRSAVDKAIAKGTTIAEFRKDFDAAVQKHGWSYKGGRGWRTRVIYDTNIRQAYNAGREAQINDPGLKKLKPYSLYRHGDSINPRELHLAWDGTVLPSDDPWWQTHTPMNGWGCKCKKFAVGARDLARMGKTGPDQAPDDGTYQWTDKQGKTHTIPNGIDPGFDYNVGEAAWGQNQQKRLMEDQGPWKDLHPWGPAKYGRPEKIAVDAPRAQLARPVKKGDMQGLRAALRKAVGSDEAHIADPTGANILVTQAISEHIAEKAGRFDGRDAYFPYIRELIEDPFEIWVNFAVSAVSGRVAIRKKYVKAVRLDKTRVLGLYAETQDGKWVSADFFRGSVTAAKNLRKGRLIYGR